MARIFYNNYFHISLCSFPVANANHELVVNDELLTNAIITSLYWQPFKLYCGLYCGSVVATTEFRIRKLVTFYSGSTIQPQADLVGARLAGSKFP